MFDKSIPVITIDGPAGTGKGTICHALAKYLNWHCLDSGAIYRVFALAATQAGLNEHQIHELVVLAHSLHLVFTFDANNRHRVMLNQLDVSEAIRQESCGQMASKFASIPEVRQALLERQRKFATAPGLVTDGRDMGTVVFPDACLKIYLTASVEERAKRRLLQLQDQGNDVTLAQVVDELTIRDTRDRERQVAPLQAASDAVTVDTSHKSIDQVLNEILDLVKRRLS
jgi:cytidylate kinase